MKRIVLIANKNWEAEPIINALLNPRFSTDATIRIPSVLRMPWLLPQATGKPRLLWNNYNNTQLELWCVQDIMEISNPSDPELYSSSEIKKDNLFKIFKYANNPPDLVLALGTAGFGDEATNNNGCVTVGSSIFIHNFHANGENPKSRWDHPAFEQLITSSLEDDFFSLLDSQTISFIESRLLEPFLNPSPVIQVLSNKDYVALSTVNITNYTDYSTSDQEGLSAIRNAGIKNELGSVETTHGVIRLASDARFAFISGITDRINHFEEDVNGKDSKGNKKTEAQNYASSFNIGVYLASALPKIAMWLNTGK